MVFHTNTESSYCMLYLLILNQYCQSNCFCKYKYLTLSSSYDFLKFKIGFKISRPLFCSWQKLFKAFSKTQHSQIMHKRIWWRSCQSALGATHCCIQTKICFYYENHLLFFGCSENRLPFCLDVHQKRTNFGNRTAKYIKKLK